MSEENVVYYKGWYDLVDRSKFDAVKMELEKANQFISDNRLDPRVDELTRQNKILREALLGLKQDAEDYVRTMNPESSDYRRGRNDTYDWVLKCIDEALKSCGVGDNNG